MRSRPLCAALLSAAFVISLPSAAIAGGYTAQGPTTQVSGDASGVLSFSGFQPNERTTASAPAAVTLASIQAVTSLSRSSDSSGSVDYKASATESGSYTITVTGQSGTVSVGTLTVLPPDAASSSAAGDAVVSAPIVWGGIVGGLALLTLAYFQIKRRALLARHNP